MSGATKILMGSGGVDLPSDDEFDNVSFLSHFDGSNNGTNKVFDDASDSNHTITTVGDTTQGTFGPFARVDGEWATSFSGGSTGLIAASSSDFTLDGEYTIEFFINLKSTTTQSFFSIGDTTNTNDIELDLFSGTTLKLYQGGYKTFSTGSDLKVGVWQHLAITRNGSNLVTCWVDGTALGSTFTLTADCDGALTIGNTFYGGSIYTAACQGTISNFRILKGTCLYTSNFTPPTSALTAITNTKILTCQSNRFIDNSTSAHTLTVTGTTPKVTAFSPILTSAVYDSAVNGASAYFDGSGDYLSVADSADLTLGDTFTLEAWIFPTTLNAYNTVASQNSSSGYYYSVLSSGAMQFYKGIGGGVQVDSAAVLIKNQWNHVAFVASSGTAYHYINGARSGSSGSIDVGDIAANLHIGMQATSTWPYTGYTSNLRIVVGTALYSGTTYTVPTAPLAAITNTKLLLNMADGQVLDSAAQNNITLLGNADSSTTQQKFGTASLAVDGTDDCASVPANAGFTNLLNSGKFTVEFFVYITSFNSGSYGDWTGVFNGSSAGWLIYQNGSTLDVYINGSTVCSASMPSTGAWHHIALTRDGTTLRLFVDGTSVATSTASLGADQDQPLRIGGDTDPGAYSRNGLNGYIDEFRISHVARYTSNFTPTTEAFPDKGQ
jgi:hypothetical protein